MTLPKRTAQHIESSKSIKRFRALLPDEWIIREVTPDYGVDFEIEVWENSDGHTATVTPTGRTCYVQLKNHDEFDKFCGNSKYSKLQINVSTINYLYQKTNAFIVVNVAETYFSVIRVKELKEFFIDKFVKPKGNKVTIPIVFERPLYSNVYNGWNNSWAAVKFYCILGNSKKWPRKNKYGVPVDYTEIGYFSLHENEDNFWKKETYANIGFYFSHHKSNANIIEIFVKQFSIEDNWGKLGILEAFDYLNYRDKETYSYALILINSENPFEVLMGLNFLAMPGQENNLDIIDSYFNNPVKSAAILEYEEYRSVEMIAVKGFKIINTNKSFKYVVGSFISDLYLIKNPLRQYLGQTLLEMANQQKDWQIEAKNTFFETFKEFEQMPQAGDDLRFYIDYILKKLEQD